MCSPVLGKELSESVSGQGEDEATELAAKQRVWRGMVSMATTQLAFG